jgi:glycosyltransferase involved in cell wall biosynthesis
VTSPPRFSIVITCYNQLAFIADTVNSALSQPHPSKEIIVVNDRSTDGSREILAGYGDAIQIVDPPENLGACRARNLGAARAAGDYLVFLDGDDILMPWALDIYDRIVDAKKPTLILGQIHGFENMVPTIKDSDKPKKIEFVEYANILQKDRSHRQSASVIVTDRRAFFEAEGWDITLFPGEDYELTLRVGCLGRCIQITAPATVFYRFHANNSIHNIPKFVGAIRQLIQKEYSGKYRRLSGSRFARYAFLGGPAMGWTKRGFRKKFFSEPFKLLVTASPMLAAATLKRMLTLVKGRSPTQTIELPADGQNA